MPECGRAMASIGSGGVWRGPEALQRAAGY
jgi:hypothetical protein